MNRRRRIVVLMGILFAAQGFLSWYFFLYLDSQAATAGGLLTCLTLILISAIVDVAVARLLFRTMDRSTAAYTADVAQRLGALLESYRLQTEREKEQAQEVGRAVSNELEAARDAFVRGDSQAVDHHLRSALDATSVIPFSTCENVVVAAVLDSKTRQCAEAGITLVAHVSIPESLPLDELEVASIFFNLIENAQYECENIALQGNAANTDLRIAVRSWIQAGQLYVEVESPRNTKSLRRRIARHDGVETRASYGLGTNIASSIAERHNGVFESHSKGDTLTTRVLIPLPQEA